MKSDTGLHGSKYTVSTLVPASNFPLQGRRTRRVSLVRHLPGRVNSVNFLSDTGGPAHYFFFADSFHSNSVMLLEECQGKYLHIVPFFTPCSVPFLYLKMEDN